MGEAVDVDVVVVGCGAAGLIAARALAEEGIETVSLEEHREIGVPEHCAGLFNIANLERLGIRSYGEYVENKVEGAIIHSPRGRTLRIDAGRPVALVASRMSLDKFLAEELEKRGGKIILGRRVTDVRRLADGRLQVTSEDGKRISARWVIDAEGMSSSIPRRIGLRLPESKMWIPAVQLWVRGHGLDPRYVYLFLEEYLPEFFAYLIPVDEHTGKLGLASRRELRRKLEVFVRKRFPRVEVLRTAYHAVYTGGPVRIDLDSRLVPVGDAAGHVKASTGGGVVMGGLIARCVAKAIASEVVRGYKPRIYLAEIRRLIRELEWIARVAKLVRRMPASMVDKALACLGDELILREISAKADMDLQFTSLSRALLRPRTIAKIFARALI